MLIEKPLAPTVDGAGAGRAAAGAGLVLMCDHTYCYTPVVGRIRELIRGGELGDIQYLDSVRINLGLVQPDVDVIWDLAPHDLSILDHVLPEDCVRSRCRPPAPTRWGRSVEHRYPTLPLPGGGIAHVHVNWLSPTKIRQTIIGGSAKMIVWDDLSPSARLQVFDKGVEVASALDEGERIQHLVSYRTGDMGPRPDGAGGARCRGGGVRRLHPGGPSGPDGRPGRLRVLQILEAASVSLAAGGVSVPLGGWSDEPSVSLQGANALITGEPG